LQVEVKRDVQDVHRFLWDINGKIRIMRFLRVPFGNKCSPFLLNATIKYHLSTFPTSFVVQELNDCLYVDDFLSGADSTSEACQMASDSDEIMSKAGMIFSKWCSNSCDVTEALVKEFGTKNVVIEIVKILGINWRSSEDIFFFDGVDGPLELCVTKRLILSCIARMFDPLGFISPFIMTAKIIFQDVW
jgi:hypothetical protein